MLVEKIKNIYDPKEKKAIELVNNIINDDTDKYIMKHKDPQTFEKIKEVNIIILMILKILKNIM